MREVLDKVSVFDLFDDDFLHFSPLGAEIAGKAFAIPNAYQNFIHTEFIGSIPILNLAFVTPASHHLHHAYNEPYIKKNFGALLCIWDRLFGTHVVRTVDPVIGVKDGFDSLNVFKIQFFPLYALALRWLSCSGRFQIWPQSKESAKDPKSKPAHHQLTHPGLEQLL